MVHSDTTGPQSISTKWYFPLLRVELVMYCGNWWYVLNYMIETISRWSYTVITQVLLFWTQSITEVVWTSSFIMYHEMSKKGVGDFLHSPAVALTHLAATCAHSAAVFALILLLSSLPCPILPGGQKNKHKLTTTSPIEQSCFTPSFFLLNWPR